MVKTLFFSCFQEISRPIHVMVIIAMLITQRHITWGQTRMARAIQVSLNGNSAPSTPPITKFLLRRIR